MLVPSAAARRFSVEIDGSVFPRSTSLITEDEISARSARARIENPCSVRKVRSRAPIDSRSVASSGASVIPSSVEL
jgi:hypothetical protein